MPSTAPLPARGLPVAPGKVERELSRLWEQMGASATRASLLNLAVYADEPGSLDANTRLVATLSRDHACRALVIAVDPLFPCHGVQAWITAHCHLGGSGAKQVCSEQISFLIPASRASVAGNILLSHLESDLPLVLWWQADPDKLIASSLLPHVDRLIFDSGRIHHPAAKLARLLERTYCPDRDASPTQLGHASRKSQQMAVDFSVPDALPRCRPILGDLNWARLRPWRDGMADIFDRPDAAELARRIDRAEVHFPACPFAADLFSAWLGPRLESLGAMAKTRIAGSGEEACCRLWGAGFELELARSADGLIARHRSEGRTIWECKLAGISEDPVELARAELDRTPDDHAYRETVARIVSGEARCLERRLQPPTGD